MTDDSTLYDRFLGRYEEGLIPWDDPVPPPEIIALGTELPPGRALDLGCGFGRTAIHLARLGWSVDGVDFIPHAIEVARERAAAAGVAKHARFYQASVAELDFLKPSYDLAIDIGCMHSFDDDLLRGYEAGLARLLHSGGRYVLFAHLLDAVVDMADRPRGIAESRIMALLSDHFQLDEVEHGTTRMGDNPVWNSAWYWFRRR